MSTDVFTTEKPTKPGIYVVRLPGEKYGHWARVFMAVDGRPCCETTGTGSRQLHFIAELEAEWKLIHYIDEDRLMGIIQATADTFTTKPISFLYDRDNDDYHQRAWINTRIQLWILHGKIERVGRGVYRAVPAPTKLKRLDIHESST